MANRVPRRVALFALGVVGLALFYAALLHRYSAPGWSRFVPASTEEGVAEFTVKREFLSHSAADEQRYEALFRYFLAGAIRFADESGSRIHYPGAAGVRGYANNGLEGFDRTGTLLAAWIASGRDPLIVDAASGKPVDLVAYLRRGILAGTDPKSRGYWGRIRSWDQRIVEASDVARIVWMTRAQIWQQLDPSQQAQVAAWLRQVDGLETPDNIWLLFPVTVDVVLRALRVDGADPAGNPNYQKFKQNYLGNGWFADPPKGVDFYNTWGMSYELFWITLISPQFDRDFIRSSLAQSADITAHLIATEGVPMMGRSICYRTAVPAPLLAENLLDDRQVDPGLARHALDVVWRHFVAHGVLQDGALTQGYYRADLRFVDYYSGPGSCHWGLRSLVLAFMNTSGSDFWRAKPQLLPVERGDYRLVYQRLGWIVSGRRDDGSVTIEIPANAGNAPHTRGYGRWRGWLEWLLRRPFRPSNEDVEYDRPTYSSAQPIVSD
ncbi:MAG: DUF2264 domain-containing protein [Steroidobacterales bacterium]